MDIISFGYYSKKKALDDVILNYKETTEKTNLILKNTVSLKRSYEKKPVTLIKVDPFTLTDDVFLRNIKELSENKYLQFLVCKVESDINSMLTVTSSDKAIEIMGMAKGFAYFRKTFADIVDLYNNGIVPENNEEEEIDYV